LGDSSDELEVLSQKRQTAEGDLRSAKARLEAARKAADSDASAHNFEKASLAQTAVKDWEARVKVNEAQLAQIDSEMQGSMRGPASVDNSQDNIILPGESVEIFVVEDTSFNSRYQVRRGGYIILPAVGRISVAGKTVQQAEKSVREALESSQLKHASVMIERIQGSDVENGPVVYLSGEFKNPRPFHIPAGTKPTLVSCILSSGGVTEKADLTRVKVMRMAANKGVVEDINVEKILDGGGLGSDVTLEEGDVVMVPGGALNVIFITGNVKSQGSFLLKPGDRLSAYTAILQRGGFAHFANEKKVFVLRATPDGTKVKIPINIAAIKKGDAPDIPLQGNDIIVVPEKFFSF
jgi:protein involved in polysaccharide export with SLBB domain